ncbi:MULTISPECIES: phosphotransferase family protein [unclassified Variovorax]|uniref:phosphotransferase family protein n=1 Tax=unclassified Variovorax TaxID=663243 RepID=UPI00257668DC|nr:MULTISPECIES: phosphotransferase family protein [unclassified Variovorax]MDM0086516.1 phosphotransferase family protein [Variovorax sp. J22G40]MDM0145227.1 phosphotransferase family protein [Variovorax sp. J2P1-31]
MSETWEALVDLPRLARWMDAQGLGEGAIEAPTVLAGGTQNLLLRFGRGGRDYVLRRPPLHPRVDGNATMRREIRVLGALAGSEVPHPPLIAGCTDTGVLGAAFYLMEPVAGFNACAGLPAPHAGDPALRHAMGLAIADGAAALGRVVPAAIGLSDLGRLDGFLERQVPRWRAQLTGYAEFEGWSGAASLGDVDAVGRWLEAHRPASFVPGLMHGDYHLANVMYRHDGPQLAAIVDWELAVQGDPLLDLGWLLATWPGADGGAVGPDVPRPWAGFPKADELIERYAQGSQRDLSQLHWYAVLACYKLAILLEGSHARACAGKADRATGDRLHAMARKLFERAAGWIDARAPR